MRKYEVWALTGEYRVLGQAANGRAIDYPSGMVISQSMLSGTLREYLRAAPFEPFVVQMTDGRRFEVPHPDFAALAPNGTKLFIFRSDDGSGITLSTLLVASVEHLRPAAH